jgi:hypothetical protein
MSKMVIAVVLNASFRAIQSVGESAKAAHVRWKKFHQEHDPRRKGN